MTKRIQYKDSFFKSLNKLTGVPIGKIRDYAKENNPFNILEHPMVLNPNVKQLEKIHKLNEFISSYNVLKATEEKNRIQLSTAEASGEYFKALLSGMKDKERFLIAFLDNGNRIIEIKTVSVGTVESTTVIIWHFYFFIKFINDRFYPPPFDRNPHRELVFVSK